MNSFLEDLGPYASMVIPEYGAQVNSLVYANTQDLVSTGAIPLTTGVMAASANVSLYQAALTEVGQGFTTGLTLGQTNSQFSKGQAPKNQVYVATHIGFEIFGLSGVDPSTTITEQLFDADSVFSLATNLSWNLSIGRGNVRTIGTLLDYPATAGGWAFRGDDPAVGGIAAHNGLPGAGLRKLATPICFPPLVPVVINVALGKFPVTMCDSSVPAVGIRCYLKGALMTAPQG